MSEAVSVLTGTISCSAHEAATFTGARALLGSKRWKIYGIIQQPHYALVDECMIMSDDSFWGYSYGVKRKLQFRGVSQA